MKSRSPEVAVLDPESIDPESMDPESVDPESVELLPVLELSPSHLIDPRDLMSAPE